MAIAAHHDEIGAALLRLYDQRRRGSTGARPDVVQLRADAVMQQVVYEVAAVDRGEQAVLYDNDVHHLGLAEIGHRLRDGARRLAAAVPGQRDTAERERSGLTYRRKEQVPAGPEQH